MGELNLVLGGARSGKSTFAQQLAQELGDGGQVLFVATAQAGDKEMRQRIEKHRQERPANWDTLEVQRDIGQAIVAHSANAKVILIDCVTMLVSNLLMNIRDLSFAETETQVVTEIQGLMDCIKATPGTFIVVSNEVGLGLVPPYSLGRTYRDLLGRANQILAREADAVHFLVAGIPLLIKGVAHSRNNR